MLLVISKVTFGTIDAEDTSFHGYYIIKFTSDPYNLQEDFNIYGQVTASVEIVFEGTYYFPIITNSH